MTEYKLICEPNTTALNMKINDLLEKGWSLYGFPFSSEHSVNQAVIRTLGTGTRPNIPQPTY